MSRAALVLSGLILTRVSLAGAQVAPGDQVRIVASSLGSGVTTGTLREIGPTELTVATDGGAVRTIPLAKLTELRRADGIQHRLGRGLALGYLAGATLGAVVASAAGRSDSEGRPITMAGALAGIVVGGILGQSRQTTRWSVVSLTTIRPALPAGARVRLRGPGGSSLGEGDLIAMTTDSIVIQPAAGPSLRIGRERVERTEWPYRLKRATGRGLGIGAAVGLLSGVMLGAMAGDDCSSGEFLCFSRGEMALAAGVMLGALGAAAGGVIGATRQVTEWEGVGPGDHQLRIVPIVTTDRLGIGAMLRF